MRRKNAFTLIELLAVIVILSIILTVTFAVINNVILDSKNKTYERQIDTLENAAKRYIVDNMPVKNENGYDDVIIKIEDLKSEGYINTKQILKNPKTNRVMTGCIVASYSKTYNQFNYVYTDYDCENEDMSTPTIEIESQKNSNDKYGFTITYPDVQGYNFSYLIGNENNETTSNEVHGEVDEGIKIIAYIKNGEHTVRKALEIS